MAGYSRSSVGELVGISPGTIEGWEIGRVRSPAVHDVLRLTHFLGIPLDEIQRAVFDDAGELPAIDASSPQQRRRAGPRSAGAVALLDAASRLFHWTDEDAADALAATVNEVRRWRTGDERMGLADFVALSSMIGLAAAEAMRGDEASIENIVVAAETLGLSASRRELQD